MTTHEPPSDSTDLETSTSGSTLPFAVQTTFRHMRASPAVAEYVLKEAQKLHRIFDRIAHCHVVIVSPHKRHRHGRRYSIHVDLGVPHGPLVVNHEPALRSYAGDPSRERKHPGPTAAHDEIYVVLHDTFDIVRHRLENHVRCLRGDVKHRRFRPQLLET
jgi:ribosome-associated translation inhibitor RaiA